MSRIAKMPVAIPAGVQISNADGVVTVKGPKASLNFTLPPQVSLEIAGSEAKIDAASVGSSPAISGTVRAILNNMVNGVSKGYERKLTLVGVGYRAQVQGKVLNLSLGFSHPVNYPIPEGITVVTPSQTEIVVSGADRHMVGQVAADVRSYRPPEPYKGKGVRYSDERVVMKEAKKK